MNRAPIRVPWWMTITLRAQPACDIISASANRDKRWLSSIAVRRILSYAALGPHVRVYAACTAFHRRFWVFVTPEAHEMANKCVN